MTAQAHDFDPRDPNLRSQAHDLAERLGGDSPLEAALRAMLDDIASGSRVIAVHADEEVTPAQAAQILGVTRQFVDRLCKDEVLPFRRLPDSSHRRIRVQDVLDVAAERQSMRAGSEAIRTALGA